MKEKMSCLSDIDLATLHKTRLEEKIQYKLSWWAHKKSTTVTQKTASAKAGSAAAPSRKQPPHSQRAKRPETAATVPAGDLKCCAAEPKVCTHTDRTADCGVTSDEERVRHPADLASFGTCHYEDEFYMSRRRRSGTWP